MTPSMALNPTPSLALALALVLNLFTNTTALADIGSKEFENTYFDVKQNTKFLNDFANELEKDKVCLFNCSLLAASLGFYHHTPDGSVKYGLVTAPYEMLSFNIANHPLLWTFYDAVNLALLDAKKEADPKVFVKPIGVFNLTEAGNVSFKDWNNQDDPKHTDKKDWVEMITGVEIINAWIPVNGTGCVYLTYESGYVCYNNGNACYNYEFSLAFKNIGEDAYGEKRYLAFLSNDWYNVFLKGSEDGGALVRIFNSALPTHDVESCINLKRR